MSCVATVTCHIIVVFHICVAAELINSPWYNSWIYDNHLASGVIKVSSACLTAICAIRTLFRGNTERRRNVQGTVVLKNGSVPLWTHQIWAVKRKNVGGQRRRASEEPPHKKRCSIVRCRTVYVNRRHGHRRLVLSGTNSQPGELRAPDLSVLASLWFSAGVKWNKTCLTWEKKQFEFSRGLKVWREFEHEVVHVSLSAVTTDREHPGTAGAARPSSNEMDGLSCFCPIWKDAACWGNRNHKEEKEEVKMHIQHYIQLSHTQWCSNFCLYTSALPCAFTESPKQREHTSLPLHGTAGSSDWVQTRTRDNRNHTERVGR